MKVTALLCLFGIASVHAGAVTLFSANIQHGGSTIIKFTAESQTAAAASITITATRPIFARSIATSAAAVTAVTQAGVALAGAHTAETNNLGTVLTLKPVANPIPAGAAAVWTLTSAVINQNMEPGLYSASIVTAADATQATAEMLYFSACGSTDCVAAGLTVPTTKTKNVDTGSVVFNFGVQEALVTDDYITITADQAIFVASQAAATTHVGLTCALGSATQTAVHADTTAQTDSTGKELKIQVKGAVAIDKTCVATMATEIMANNPATAGLVKVSYTTTKSTVAATSKYAVYNAAATSLFVGADVGADEKSTDPTSLDLTVIPQTELAVAAKYTFTASTAIFSTTSNTLTCAATSAFSAANAIAADCTATSDSTGKILAVTLAQNKAFAGYPYSVRLTDTTAGDIADNTATPGAGPTFTAVQSAGDTTATAAVVGYYVFNAALTPYFNSASVTTLTGLAAPGNMTLQFVPQGTVAGATSGTARNVIFTASAAVFDASGSYPGSACQGNDCIVCTSSLDGYSTTVPCTAASDSTGKVLTVTATTASTATDSNDFTADKIGQVVLTNHQVNPNATAVTFTVSTGVDTTATAAGTGYTTTSVAAAAGAAPSPPGATNTGTYSTATTTVSFTGYTYVAGTATTNFANVVGCAYAKTVSDATTSLTSHMCGASSGPTFTYMTGASTTNTASAARRTGTSVAVGLKMYHSLISQTAATAAVTAVGTSLTAINANLAAINTAAGTGFSTTQITATGMTAATWTHSSAAVVVPSMMAMFSALVLVLMQ